MSKRNRRRKTSASEPTTGGDLVGSKDLARHLPVTSSSLHVEYHADAEAIAPVAASEIDAQAATIATPAPNAPEPMLEPVISLESATTIHPSVVALAEAIPPTVVEPPLSVISSAAAALVPAVIAEDNSLGARLLAARKQSGLSREEVARRLHVSTALVDALERDDWSRLGAPVYVRGHLFSLAREVGLPAVVVQRALAQLVVETPLIPTVIARSRGARFGRQASALTYIMLTLLLAIPTVTMFRSRGVSSPVPQVRALVETSADFNTVLPADPSTQAVAIGPVDSAPATASAALTGTQSAPTANTGPAAETAAPAPPSAPLMASMAPVSGDPRSLEARSDGEHRVTLIVTADSWIELVDAQGTRLEYGILRAGDRRDHLVRGPVSLNFGNVSGVRLQLDGAAVDLQPYARLNVARLRLLEPQPTAPPAAR